MKYKSNPGTDRAEHESGLTRLALINLPITFSRGETIRVLESPSSDRRVLMDAILKGHYRKPYIGEDPEGRSLYFSPHCVQSRMRLNNPWALDLLYTRKAMSFLLFQPKPQDILMLGLGGGSIAKYVHRHLPYSQVDAVEVDANVIALGEYFCVPPPSARFRIIHSDAADYIARTDGAYDVVISDAFDGNGIAPSFRHGSFYERVRSRLRAGGMLVANLAGTKSDRLGHLTTMARAFAGNVLLVPVEGEGNEIAVAFNTDRLSPSWKAIRELACSLRQSLGLDFPRFAGRLERSHRLGYLRRALSHSLR